MFTARSVIGLQAAGAALALCFAAGHADARISQLSVHRKPVTIAKVGQICCPVVTFYRVRWGGTNQGLVNFPCRHPHAFVLRVAPALNEPRNKHKGRAWIQGCTGLQLRIRFVRLRD